MNPLLFRTLQDKPINEKLLRGLQDLNTAQARLVIATTKMIASGHACCDQVDRMIEGE